VRSLAPLVKARGFGMTQFRRGNRRGCGKNTRIPRFARNDKVQLGMTDFIVTTTLGAGFAEGV
jgi:hypothetical protein